MKTRIALLLMFTGCFCSIANANEGKDDEEGTSKLSGDTLSGLKFRNVGPATLSGRISDVAIDTVKPNTWYVAAGSGNLWKTTNAGTTWSPIFEKYGSYSIGCVTIDPRNRHTVWVGTGEDVGGRHVGYGDGVYRSLDGGKSFQNMGLKNSEHIAKILVDPRNSRIIYVAAQGPLWSPGGERGLYKSVDGGQSWEQILAAGPYTGVTDVEIDPRHPSVVFAVTHQHHRTVATVVNGGPESGIHKSVDGGRTWRELTNGLPDEDMGKTAIALSPQQPDVIYATIELAGRTGGFWRSADGGETWSKQSDYISGGTGPHYYQEIWCDPHRFDVIYQANVRLGRSEDGGKNWNSVDGSYKHVDNHAIGFHPTDPDFLLVGCDGGLYRSSDYAKTYAFCANLPLTQFYKLDVDNDSPFYNIVGGTQDNGTQYGPSRTGNDTGIRNSDWRVIIGADGHDCAFDPNEPNIVYCEGQQGFLRRYDHRTGQSIDIRPQPEKGEEPLRFNWDSPVHVSPHSPTRIYYGANRLFRSDDRGDSWAPISPDLSRGLDRFKSKVMERVWSVDAVYDNVAMSKFGTITSISESPLQEGLIYVGTDDGLIQVTDDGGKTWRKIEKIYDVPEFSFVNDIKADLHEPNTVYAVLDNHKTGDLKPYLLKSTDRGETWESIAGDLPERQIVWRFVQDHVKPDLCFVGAEFGIYCTLSGGKKWIQLKGGVPTISFRDLEIQERENDLVGASFGRSFFVLDDYSPLRLLSDDLLKEHELVLFPVRKSLLFIPARVFGRQNGTQGDSFYSADNPPYGAVFTYYLRDGLKTAKETRREEEAKIKEAAGDNPYPGWDAIKQEEREEGPLIILTIKDGAGNLVNRVDGPSSAGIHRVAWNLRFPPFTAGGSRGPLAAPGTYSVSAAKRVKDEVTALGEPQTFEVVPLANPSLAVPERPDVLAFQRRVGELQRTTRGADAKIEEALGQMVEIKRVVKQSEKAGPQLWNEVRQLELRLLDAREMLTGDRTSARRGEAAVPSILQRIDVALRGSLDNVYAPTKTHERQYEIALEEYQQVSATLRSLLEEDLVALEEKLEEAGVPWTPGRRLPELNNR